MRWGAFLSIRAFLHKLGVHEWIVILMAIGLQVQINLFANDAYLGLRVGLSDLFLPVLGGYVLLSLMLKKSAWPVWSVPKMNIWLLALVCVMSVALINGYISLGALSSWAFFNKYIGFFVLLAYLLLASWLVTNAKDPKRLILLFVVSFVGFITLTLSIKLIFALLMSFLPKLLWIIEYPWDGFMVNRNAFMVLAILALTFVVWAHRKGEGSIKLPRFWGAALWINMPSFLMMNESRTGWIAFVILFLAFLCRDTLKRAFYVIPLLCVGGLFSYCVFLSMQHQSYGGNQLTHFKNVFFEMEHAGEGEELSYIGDQKRLIALEDSLELYGENTPILGAGLGTFMPFQVEKRGELISSIDVTSLWLLVETGALGAFIFAGFFMACLWGVFKRRNDKHLQSFYRAVLVFLCLFAAMTILHELLYTRVLWFIGGLALACSLYSRIHKQGA